ncbi:DUF1413 domain-containing protein [Rummeliibacillus stabekisii]|uniref:DUF1413 domain-containing protein n=1 Tax=Rummeliibacillus stabekisii TaxID=241244 RepID=UPI000A036694
MSVNHFSFGTSTVKLRSKRCDAILPTEPIDTRCYKKSIQKVNQLSSGIRITIKAVFGTEWTMGKGVKLSLDKTVLKRVQDGIIPNVEAGRKRQLQCNVVYINYDM